MGDITKIQNEVLNCPKCKKLTTHHVARTINSRYTKCLGNTQTGAICHYEEYVGPRGHERVEDGKWVAIKQAK